MAVFGFMSSCTQGALKEQGKDFDLKLKYFAPVSQLKIKFKARFLRDEKGASQRSQFKCQIFATVFSVEKSAERCF